MTRFESRLLGAVFLAGILVTSGRWPNAARDVRVQQLIVDLKSSAGDVRVDAYRELRGLGPAARAAVPALIEQLEDPWNTDVINALLAIGPGSALEPLTQALDTKGSAARGAAMVIAAFGPAARSARPALLKAREDPELRSFAVSALREID
ncbi:MAG: hypothetical protein ACHQ4J_06615 [Candidatus Binatia bacterium]